MQRPMLALAALTLVGCGRSHHHSSVPAGLFDQPSANAPSAPPPPPPTPSPLLLDFHPIAAPAGALSAKAALACGPDAGALFALVPAKTADAIDMTHQGGASRYCLAVTDLTSVAGAASASFTVTLLRAKQPAYTHAFADACAEASCRLVVLAATDADEVRVTPAGAPTVSAR